jgi:hypothetical protein
MGIYSARAIQPAADERQRAGNCGPVNGIGGQNNLAAGAAFNGAGHIPHADALTWHCDIAFRCHGDPLAGFRRHGENKASR